MPATPAKTTVRVATTNNAAKDDYFHDLSWLAEDAELRGCLDVLGNDPGSAKLIGVSQNLPTNNSGLVNGGSTFTPTGFTNSISVTIVNGKLEIDASGLNGELQSMGEGMTRSITFYYTAQMANGAYSTAKVTIDIEGTNDDPEFGAGGLAGEVVDTADDDDYADATGTVTATDVDSNDAGLLTFGLGDGEDGLSNYGTFTIESDGDWTFVADDAAVEGLKTTEVVTFDIKVNDGHGGSDTETVTITLKGVNDTAEISGDNEGEVTEDGTLSTGGTLSVADRDVADVGFQAATGLAGTYGDFTFDEDTGEWTYTLRNGDANVQALGAGDTETDTLTVYSADGETSETITVTITGAADGPPPFVYDPPEPVNTGTSDPNNKDNEATGASVVTTTTGNGASANNPHHFGTAGNDTINGAGSPGNNKIYGGAGNDTLNGNNGNDEIYGGSGNDTIDGGDGQDKMYGGDGIDTITGNIGNDTIWGGFGADNLTGGGGTDTYVYLSALDTGDSISDFGAGDTIDLVALGVTGSAGALTGAGEVGSHQVGFITSAGVTTLYVDVDGVYGADLEIALTNGYAPLATDFVFAP